MKKIVFLTGTRADYGKIKSLMKACEASPDIELYVFAIGMHLLEQYGRTLNDIINDGYKNVFYPHDYIHHSKMELNLAETIEMFSKYIESVKPDLIVVHGDRVEPLAGAIVGAMNNIKVAHIEGGEVTGTADEFMRHAITKLSTIHFVSNDEAKFRLLQLGEEAKSIYVIGSPDIDIMLSNNKEIDSVRKEYDIKFDEYAILIYHPVTTSTNLEYESDQVARALIDSGENYIVIMPNDDHGCEIIRSVWSKFENNEHFKIYDSISFEDFLELLKCSKFIVGNSSAGVREACVYGVPAIDIGSRQEGRYRPKAIRNIQHCDENIDDILNCIKKSNNYRYKSKYFGDGHSADLFLDAIKRIDNTGFQKHFVDTSETTGLIMNYINEVCF